MDTCGIPTHAPIVSRSNGFQDRPLKALEYSSIAVNANDSTLTFTDFLPSNEE